MPCSGNPDPCSTWNSDQTQCEICGCTWDYEFSFCFQQPDDCNTFGINDCEDCGCTWTTPGINMKIDISNTWRDCTEMKINIGGSWKVVTEIKINIGDVWKTVYTA